MTKAFFAIIFIGFYSNLQAQKFVADSSYVRFFSEAPIENIEATNVKGASVFDSGDGRIVFSIPIKNFTFDKSLMQEHFNENYLESDKYPKASFSGKIDNWSKTSGSSKATASGEMTIHGVTKEVSVEGDLVFTEDMVSISATFPIEVANYKIKIPKAVFYNIAEIVEVTVYFEYKPNE